MEYEIHREFGKIHHIEEGLEYWIDKHVSTNVKKGNIKLSPRLIQNYFTDSYSCGSGELWLSKGIHYDNYRFKKLSV